MKPIEGAVIGLISSETDYRLSWLINKQLHFNLVKQADIEITNAGSTTPSCFSVFGYYHDKHTISYRLIANKFENLALIRKFKNIDYFLVAQGSTDDENMQRTASELKKINGILGVFILLDKEFLNLFELTSD